jgi:hypothetical protein
MRECYHLPRLSGNNTGNNAPVTITIEKNK